MFNFKHMSAINKIELNLFTKYTQNQKQNNYYDWSKDKTNTVKPVLCDLPTEH